MKYIKRIFENNKPKMTEHILKYFSWSEMSKLICDKFDFEKTFIKRKLDILGRDVFMKGE